MGGKKNAIERANKRLLNEALPPTIMFTEHEVLNIMCELIEYDLGGEPDIPERLTEVFQKALKKKGRIFPPDGHVDPEGMYR